MNKENIFFKIAQLIANEFDGSISVENRKYLDNWLNKSIENRKIYDSIKRDGWYQSNLNTSNKYMKKEGWNKVSSRIQSKPKVLKLFPNLWKYTAAVIVLSLGYFFKDNLFSTSTYNNVTPLIVDINVIEPGTDKATLTLDDGSQIALEKGESFQIQNANSNGEEIIYKAGERNTNKLTYNYLTIPRGGQFFIKLSDGTRVWLNSESQLKYPVSFPKGETREVELVYGEAYFDVSPSTRHDGSKFIVTNQSQEVEVLGTEFNIKAYKDETNIYTTLVEGKVLVQYNSQQETLAPNQQSVYNLNANSFKMNNVEVYDAIAWKEGVFSFENKSLKEIMKVLSRWYDVEVEFQNKELEKEEFIGNLSKNQNLSKILETIKNFEIIKDYSIRDKKIIIQ